MAETVVGFFDNSTEAQTAVQRLQSSGISQDRIDVSSGSGSAGNVAYSDSTDSDRSGRDSENGITRFFKNLFGDDDDEADRYSHVAGKSSSIVTVHAQSREEAERAADILDDCGAVDVDERAAQYGYSNTRSTESMGDRANISSDRNMSGERDQTIERMEENLEVGKRTVERGGVRVRSRIVERPVEEHVRLREENVHIERNPVDRPVSGDAFNNFREGEIEMTERAEVPVVNKEARVVEEVRVSKDVTERDETIRDSVRHTEIDVDNTGTGTGTTRRSDTDLDDDNYSDSNRSRGL